jgi:adenylate cyclase
VGAGAESREHTFLFADLSGYTALTEAHGDEEAADLVAGFSAEVRAMLSDHDAELVKTIGDALMLRCRDAGSALRLGLEIVNRLGARPGFPAIRVGMHTGPAVERDGDWFGSTVNVAARVCAAAAGGEVLLTAETRRAATHIAGVELRERGRRRLRNVPEPVVIYEAATKSPHSAEGLPIDPVCRMAVDPEHAAGRIRHQKRDYYFCSLECLRAFAGDPASYIED